MNPAAWITPIPWDFDFADWVHAQDAWTAGQKAQVIAEYVDIRALERQTSGNWEDGVRIVRAHIARKRQHEAALLDDETFRRHQVAINAGGWGNYLAGEYTKLHRRLSDLGLRLTAGSAAATELAQHLLSGSSARADDAAERGQRPTRYQFSLN